MGSWQSDHNADPVFNIVSVLYHAMSSAQACDRFIADAELAHDDELIAFFEFVREQETTRAARARELLAHRLGELQSGARPDPEVLRDFENAAE